MKNIFKKAAEGIKNTGKKTVEFVKDNRDTITMVSWAIVGSVIGGIMFNEVYKRGVRKGIINTTNAFNKIGVTDGYYICSQSTNDGEIYRVTHGKSADGKVVPMGRMFNSIVGCCMEHDEATDTNFDIENYMDSGINVSAELSDKVECEGDYVEFKPTE